LTAPRSPWEKLAPMERGPSPQLRIMLGFVVRQCARRLGHPPRPEELADWANNQVGEHGRRYHIFGRAITADEARVMLRNPDRLVTVRPGPRWSFAATAGR
jgi:hypothetical protein